MARGKLILENDDGKLVTAPLGFSWATLLLGPFSPLFRGDVGHFIIAALAALLSLGLSWLLIYPFFYNVWFLKGKLKKGYRVADIVGTDIETVERRLKLRLPFHESFGERKERTATQRKDPAAETETNAAHGGDEQIAKNSGCLWIIIVFVVIVAGLTGYFHYDNERMAALRENDPEAYLAELNKRSGEQDKYWQELETLYPERYAREWPAEQQRRKEAAERRQQKIDEKNATLAWEGELHSTDIPDGIYCSEEYGGDTLEPHTWAHYHATEHIKGHLLTTASGNFPVTDYTAIYVDACTYTLHSWFEAQNVFGAEIRTYYRATVQLDDDESGGAFIYGFRQGERSRLLRK